MAVRGITNPTEQQQIHALDLRILSAEHEIKALKAEVAELRGDLSEQGKAPRQVSANGTTPKPLLLGVVPGTAKEIATILVAVTGFLTATGLVSYVGASNGGNTGATTAVEDAVEQAEALPVAAPVIRVVPVPKVVPVPMPSLPEPEQDPVTRPDDLLPDPREAIP